MLFRGRDDFIPTLGIAAERLGIPPVAVEKDYWLCQVLRRLAAEFTDRFVFKGGTSLSKAHSLVNRFSEDIDILIVKGGASRRTVDDLMKGMALAAANETGGRFISAGFSDRGIHRDYDVTYSGTQQETGLIRHSLRLEMGIRGGPNPSEHVAIEPYLAAVLKQSGIEIEEFEDLHPVDLLVLSAGRTLLEKLHLVHEAAVRFERGEISRLPQRIERHFYDIYMLVKVPSVLAFLEDRDAVSSLIADIQHVSDTYFSRPDRAPVSIPKGGYGESPAFREDSPSVATIAGLYESNMPELFYGAATELAPWDEVCRAIPAALRGRLPS